MPQPLVLVSGISSYFAWGIRGLNLALNWARDPAIEAIGAVPINPKHIVADALRLQALGPFFARSARLQEDLAKFADASAALNMPAIVAFGNEFRALKGAHGVDLRGNPTIAAIVFEEPL